MDVEHYRCQIIVERLVYAKHQRLQMLSKTVLTYFFGKGTNNYVNHFLANLRLNFNILEIRMNLKLDSL
jgi:hypothetical protein